MKLTPQMVEVLVAVSAGQITAGPAVTPHAGAEWPGHRSPTSSLLALRRRALIDTEHTLDGVRLVITPEGNAVLAGHHSRKDHC